MFNRPAAPRARRWLTGVALAATLVAAPTAAAAPDPATSWHGRSIQRPEPTRSVAQPAWPRGWSAGPVFSGTGSIRASRRVRGVQRELHARGYRVGPADGRFGPRTRGAVTWFQIKHGLEPTGRVDAATLAELRTRRDPQVTLSRTVDPTPTPTPTLSLAAVPERPGSNVVGAVLLLLTLATTLALIALYWRRSPQAPPAKPSRPSAVSRTVLGYIVVDPDSAAAHERVAVATAAIAAWCDARDWHLERVIHDAHRHPDDRPGLAYVMDRVNTGSACGIVVRHVSDLAESAADLAQMLQWINDADGFVMAVDEWLDPNLPPGRLSAGALVELSEWRSRRAGGRGGLGAEFPDVPALRGRVVAMRERGMSLQAIADALNAAGVPTLRGGSHWRPSGVQVLAGYTPPPAPEPMRRNG
ncbi:peptidoglycan-binding protein [Solirubrobacter taibaiensis]|nr:peptidoglycan-binding protein [Solirubrobacter taibaiensis]